MTRIFREKGRRSEREGQMIPRHSVGFQDIIYITDAGFPFFKIIIFPLYFSQ